MTQEQVQSQYQSNIPRLGMFADPELRPGFLGDNTTGYILPAHNPTVSKADANWNISWTGYREVSDAFPAPFSGWFVTLGMQSTTRRADGKEYTNTDSGVYNGFGKSRSMFISPRLIGQRDPIIDLRVYIYQLRKQGNTEFMRLVERKAWPEKEALPSPQRLFIANAYCTGYGKDADAEVMKYRPIVIPARTMAQLERTLNELSPGGVTPIDPNNQYYKWGDITNPSRAVRWTVRPLANGEKGRELFFGDTVMRGGQLTLDYHAEAIPEEIMRARIDLANDFKVYSYDDIVLQILAEGEVPRDLLITSKVADKCNHFPTEEEVREYANSGAQSEANNQYQPAPAAQAAPQQTTAPAQQQTYQQPSQAYQQPAPAPQQPVQAQPYQQQAPAPSYPQPTQAQAPQQAYQQPAPAYQQPAPVQQPVQYAAPAPAPAPAQQQVMTNAPDDQIPGLGAEPWNSPNLTPEESAEMKELYSHINHMSDSKQIDRLGFLMTKATATK